MARAKGTVKASVKKKPVKAGSTAPKNIGGILNYKVVAMARKRKQKQNT